MKAAVLAGLLAALAAAVIAFATGLVLLGYAATGCGVLWLALAGTRRRSSTVGGALVVEPVADVLARVADVNGRIGPLLVELLNHPDSAEQCVRLRQLGQHLGSLSAELLARAAEFHGRAVGPPERVVIDARAERSPVAHVVACPNATSVLGGDGSTCCTCRAGS